MKIIKCVMVGDGCAGKTYAAEAYRKKCFPTYLGGIPTVFDSFRLTVNTGSEDVTLYVHDTGGMEDFDRLRSLSYKGVDVVLIWFNVTKPYSLDNVLLKWHPEIKHYCPTASYIVVGSQIDLREDSWTLEKLKKIKQRFLTYENGFELAKKINAETYLECSSKTLVGIDSVFETAARIGSTFRDTKGNDKKTYGIDPALIRMIKTSKELFNEVLKLGMEENYDIRVMAVGQAGVGKSTLTRRMLKLPVKIKEYNSTNGIEVHIHCCQIDLDTGKWVYQKRGLVSNIVKILQKRQKKHESRSKSAKKRGGPEVRVHEERFSSCHLVTKISTREFHQRYAKLLQNFQDAGEIYFKYRTEMHRLECGLEDIEDESRADKKETVKIESTEKVAVHKETETGSVEKSETPPKLMRKPNVISNEDVDETIETAKTIKPVKYNHRSKVSFYDFAGQDIFHASHPTFLSPKSVYALVFDLNKMYSHKDGKREKKYGRVKFFGDCRGGGTLGDIECIFFWMNVIYLFAAQKDGIYPQVILVGTHKDKLPKTDRSKIIEQCFKDLRREIADTPLKEILSQVEVAVDNTRKTDESFSQLKEEILHLARLQPQWGQKTPTKWLPLNRELQYLKEDGLKVISVAELEELNESLDVKVTDKTELDMFLQFQHDSGEIIWFSEEVLRNYIVLDQVWLIDALKKIITAERFALRIPKLAEKWQDFNQTGMIERSTIVNIFEESEDPALFENHEHVLLLMEKFLFIASPLTQLEEPGDSGGSVCSRQLGGTDHSSDSNLSDACVAREGEVTDAWSEDGSEIEMENIRYIMPCMVHKVANCAPLLAADDIGKTHLFCMVSTSHFLPLAVFQKVLAMCIKKWPIVEQKGEKLLYCGLCKFNIDNTKNYKLLIFLVGYAIHARIENFVGKIQPPTVICAKVRSFLTQSLRSVLLGMGFSDKFRSCIQCPRFDPLDNGGYFDIEYCEDKEAFTCDDCEPSHSLQTGDILSCWLEKKPLEQAKNDSLANETTDVEDRNITGIDANETPRNETVNHDMPDSLDANSYEEETPITHEHINHARVCNALVSVCADALREVLLSQVPAGYHSIYDAISANKQVLTGMRQLRQEQLALIFPDPLNRYTGTVDQFDITLLYALIRNISSVPAPVNGWGRPPDDNPRDTSLSANVERIRMCRNKVSGHSVDGKLDNQYFEAYWEEIGEMLDDIENAVGDRGFKGALERRKQQVITPQEAHLLKIQIKTYQSQLQEDMQPLVVAWENMGEQLKKLQTDMDTKL